MNISHHLTDETILDYAAGTITTSMEVVIACHLTYCASCRAKSDLADSAGGDHLDKYDPTPTQATAREILECDSSTPETCSTATHHVAPGVPRPLGKLLPTTLEDLDWKRIAPGIQQHNLSIQPRREGAFKLLKLAPGVVLSEHTHHDRELTLVLQGSYKDEIGRFACGDIADLDADITHRPVVDTEEPCIALIATTSPVSYSGLLGKIMQPFVGI